jgi:hypothetical protein
MQKVLKRTLRKRDCLRRQFWEHRKQALAGNAKDMLYLPQLQHLQVAADLPLPDGPGQGGALVDLALGFLLRQYLVILFIVLLGGNGSSFSCCRAPNLHCLGQDPHWNTLTSGCRIARLAWHSRKRPRSTAIAEIQHLNLARVRL